MTFAAYIVAGVFFFTPVLFLSEITLDPFLVKETAAQTLILGAALIAAVGRLEKRTELRFPPLLLPFALFLAAVIASLVHAAHSILVFEYFMAQGLLMILYVLAFN